MLLSRLGLDHHETGKIREGWIFQPEKTLGNGKRGKRGGALLKNYPFSAVVKVGIPFMEMGRSLKRRVGSPHSKAREKLMEDMKRITVRGGEAPPGNFQDAVIVES